jgi:hypothetical protein
MAHNPTQLSSTNTSISSTAHTALPHDSFLLVALHTDPHVRLHLWS